jgi:hypothetical protein
MNKIINVLLVLGFLFVDLLFFHDVFKPGEVTTLPQYLTGILSIPVIVFSAQNLLKQSHKD